MDFTIASTDGIAVSSHHLASQTAIAILRQGGTAIEAIVAAAATIAVVFGQFNSIGSDSFFLIVPPEGEPFVIDGSGPAGSLVSIDDYPNGEFPRKGPKTAITVPGTISAWKTALDYVSESGFESLPLERLLEDAIRYAEDGFPVTPLLSEIYNADTANNFTTPDIQRIFANATEVGQLLRQPELANTLRYLVRDGLDSFYRGGLAKYIAGQMVELGMPITESDLANYHATIRSPLKLEHSEGIVYGTPPSTQGLVTLIIIGILDQLRIDGVNDELFIHAVVEATKQGFRIRDEYITDPRYMQEDPEYFLTKEYIAYLASQITVEASNYSSTQGLADTVWLGAADKYGYTVSFIQSLYETFGSGVVIPGTGILWQNRGTAFSLNKDSIIALEPGKKPFHTLNPGAAKFNDGRTLVFGTSGGDGQPQTMSTIFHRYVVQGLELHESINLPRWVFGRTTGARSSLLRVEDRFSNETVQGLIERGHDVEIIERFDPITGQSGMVIRRPDGILEAASDPRGDGSAVGF